jgi:hypothetical protein
MKVSHLPRRRPAAATKTNANTKFATGDAPPREARPREKHGGGDDAQ